MVRRYFVDPEDRKLFEKWGTKRVKEMLAAGHFEAELRRPMAIWIAERDARASKGKRLAIIAVAILALVILLVIVLRGTEF